MYGYTNTKMQTNKGDIRFSVDVASYHLTQEKNIEVRLKDGRIFTAEKNPDFCNALVINQNQGISDFNASAIRKIAGYICFALSAMAAGMSVYKLWFYNKGGEYGLTPVNAYVGGDAYNYIINGEFSTAYAVLAVLFSLWGYWLVKAKD